MFAYCAMPGNTERCAANNDAIAVASSDMIFLCQKAPPANGGKRTGPGVGGLGYETSSLTDCTNTALTVPAVASLSATAQPKNEPVVA